MLLRKLWRDIKDNYGGYLAVTSVIIIGLMLYVSMSIILENLLERQEKYYQDTQFADGFAQVVRAPMNITKDIERLEGIKRVSGRIVKDVLVNKSKGDETTTLRMISFAPDQTVNSFRLEEGRIPGIGEREILVSPAFLKGNNIKIGEKIPLILMGREVKFTITGTANSPEFIYEIPTAQSIAPNPKLFGIAYVSYQTVAPLMGMDRQINDVVFTLEKNVKFNDVKQATSRLLDDYGLMQIYPRKDQLSHSMLDQELVGLDASATTTPIMFLLVAASILYIMLRRMVEHQRGQIGILKAFGFNNREIITHYLGYAVIIGFAGGLGGSLAGGALSYSFATLYQQYYNIPGLNGSFSLKYIVIGTVASVIFSAFAGFQGAKQILNLSPSEAMRPPVPKDARRTLVERITFLWKLLSTQGKMAIRNLFRSKQRTSLAVLGISAAFSMMVAAGATFDATDYLIVFQYDKVEKYDIKVGLSNYSGSNEAATAAKHIAGVKNAEPLLEVPVSIYHKWLKRDALITGLPKDAELFNLVTNTGEAVELPEKGLVLSSQMAKLLDVQLGEKVTVKPFLGDKRERQVTVKKIVPQYVGLGAYMEIEELSEMLAKEPVASSVLLKVDKDKLSGIRKELQEAKNVAAIHDKISIKRQFEELMASSKSTQFILLFFAFLTGFAIVYNVTLISLSERERELATLLILGMTEREVGRILVFEQVFMGLSGVAVGIPLSYAMLYAMINAMANELYNMPVIISTNSLLTGIAGTVLFLLASQWKVKAKIADLSMLDVLKQQE